MKIVIAGAGYVGLVTGACFADLGFAVVCCDRDQSKIALLEAGKVPFYEPGLADVVARNTHRTLRFSSDLGGEVAYADIVFIAVGTPTANGGEADLSAVKAAAIEIARNLKQRTAITLKSTVPVGTARMIEALVREAAPRAQFAIVSNPEFLREGAAVSDFMTPDRVVIGLRDDAARTLFERLYRPLAERGVPLLFMHNEAAELCKYAANTYLAMRIAYVNELADICEAVGADVGDVTAGMGFDKRIGRHYLSPGPGFGGSCFPKDTRALLATTRSAGVNFSLGEAIIYSNDRRKELLKSRVVGALGGSVAGRTIAILGLAFKADTDDVRDSAALPLIEALQGEGAAIRAFDPEAMPQAATSLHGVAWCKDTYEAATGADAAVIMTEWEVFRRLDLKRLATLLRRPLLIDFRNLHAPQAAAEAGLGYVSIGRPAAHG